MKTVRSLGLALADACGSVPEEPTLKMRMETRDIRTSLSQQDNIPGH
jgi:hypothetical protein